MDGPRAYYNEHDPFAAAWLRNLIAGGHIAAGDVDERSIVDVRPDDLRGYTQCHFFAGLGGWSYALRLAGWPDDRPVWTGSCPCQPFSAAGKGEAFNDERHLWPVWFPLIKECRPARVYGEQVEAAIGWGWLDAVFADLEAEEYACGTAVLPACGIGAPHIRQRLWFVADDTRNRRRQGRSLAGGGGEGATAQEARSRSRDGRDGDMVDANGTRSWARREAAAPDGYGRAALATGWPTPNAGPQNDADTTWQRRRRKLSEKHGNNGFGLTLGQVSQLTSWPTPTAHDADRGGKRSEPQE